MFVSGERPTTPCCSSCSSRGGLPRLLHELEQQSAGRAEQEARQRLDDRGQTIEILAGGERPSRDAGEPFAVRWPDPRRLHRVLDLIRGEVSILHDEVDDWVLCVAAAGCPPTTSRWIPTTSRWGSPTSWGEEHLVNTPKQNLVYEALGAETARLRSPCSCSARMPQAQQAQRTLTPASATTGRTATCARPSRTSLPGSWPRPIDGDKVLIMQQLVEALAAPICAVSKGGAVFEDPEKFRWLAGEYLRQEEPSALAEHGRPTSPTPGSRPRRPCGSAGIGSCARAARSRSGLTLYADAADWLRPYFVGAVSTSLQDPKALKG